MILGLDLLGDSGNLCVRDSKEQASSAPNSATGCALAELSLMHWMEDSGVLGWTQLALAAPRKFPGNRVCQMVAFFYISSGEVHKQAFDPTTDSAGDCRNSPFVKGNPP